MTAPTITIDMEKKCDKCGHKGVLERGLCLKCAAEGMWRTTAGTQPEDKK